MHLAFCLFHYFPYGGLQRDFLNIANECQKRGHDIHVYTMAWEGEKPAHFHLHLVPRVGLTNHQRAKNFAQQLQPLLQEAEYDAVIGFNKMPGLDIYFAADHCFAKKHSLLKYVLPRYYVYQELENAVFSPSAKTKILYLTDKQRQDFTEIYHTPSERFFLLPPGIDPGFQFQHVENQGDRRQTWRKHYGLSHQQKLILMVCSYFKTKGLDRSLYAIAALPQALREQVMLFVVGGDDPKPYTALIKKLGLTQQVRFFGAQDKLLPFYLGADILLHPAYREAAGMVLIEALASGLPILTTDICGYSPHVLAANAGKVLPSPFQQQQCNSYLAQMLTSTEDQHRWRNNALQYAKQQDFFGLSQRVADIIEGA